MDALRLESLRKAFDTQDKPMIEAVQRNMGTIDLDSLGPVMLSTDGGPVRARRVLKQLLADEANGCLAGRAVPVRVATAPMEA